MEQLQPRYGVAEDTDPGVVTSEQSTSANSVPEQPKAETLSPPAEVKTSDQTVPEYGRHNPRRSSRQRKPRQLYDAQLTFLIVFKETFKTSEEVLCKDYISPVYMYNIHCISMSHGLVITQYAIHVL